MHNLGDSPLVHVYIYKIACDWHIKQLFILVVITSNISPAFSGGSLTDIAGFIKKLYNYNDCMCIRIDPKIIGKDSLQSE